MDKNTALYLSQFAMLTVAHALAVMSPGPDFAVIVNQSVRHGQRIGIITALGIGCGLSLHVIYTLFGIGILLVTHDWAMTIAKLIGAAYLLWMGISLLRAQPAPSPLHDPNVVMPDTPSARKAFLRGFLTNATNPKVTLFFLAIFTTIVSADTPLTIQALYGLWLCLSTALWFTFVAVMLSRPAVRKTFMRLGHWFERMMGGVLILFAIRLLWDEVDS